MRGRLVVGNWKMNGGLAQNAALLSALAAGWRAGADREMAVCVPFPYLAQARELLAGSAVAWGAQDVSEHASGAFTGEVSAAMIAEFGARYALAGHSERRQFHGERDEQVAAKARAALSAGLTPIVCVGETLAEREAGRRAAMHERMGQAAEAGLAVPLEDLRAAFDIRDDRVLDAVAALWVADVDAESGLIADIDEILLHCRYPSQVKRHSHHCSYRMSDLLLILCR